MSRYSKESFNKNIPVYVRRKFNGAGRNWIPGQRFSWNKLALDVRRVRLLFDGGYLTHIQPEDFSAEEEIEDNTPKATDGEPLRPGYTIVRTAGPWHDVVGPDGEKVNEKGLKKFDALALVEELTMETAEHETEDNFGVTEL